MLNVSIRIECVSSCVNLNSPHFHISFCLSFFQLQQMEEAQMQQREANLTALAAIGPRKTRPVEQTENQVGLCGVFIIVFFFLFPLRNPIKKTQRCHQGSTLQPFSHIMR